MSNESVLGRAPGAPGGGGKGLVTGASIVAALGGLLFGYDTGVISIAAVYLVPDFGLSDTAQQVVVSSLLIGAVIGVLFGGPLSDRAGRKNTLLGVTVVFTIAALGCGFAPEVGTLIVARFVLGLAIGVSSLVVPTYIAEMSPPQRRGVLVSLHQLMVTVGILVSYLVGYGFSGDGAWRWMLGLAAAPSIVMFFGLLSLPESPRWFMVHGRTEEARSVLARTRSAEEAESEMNEIATVIASESRLSYRELLGPRYRRWISVGVAAAGTSQVVGVNAVIYYAPTILKNAGFGNNAAILASIGIGTVNVLFTVLALLFIDRLGRRPLILGGGSVVILALLAVGALFLMPVQGAVAIWLVGVLIIYEAAFACSLGIAIWLVNSEIFPSKVRGKAASFGIVSHWGLDFLVSISVLTMISAFTATGVFWLYALLGIVGLVYLYRWLPETKNRTLEEIETALSGETSDQTTTSSS